MKDLFSLKDKVAIVTGAGRGIGAATVELFSALGARVVATDISEASLHDGVAKLPSVTCAYHDISSQADWAKVIAKALGLTKNIDILVNNAGIIGDFHPIQTVTPEEMRQIFEVNQMGVLHGMQAVIPSMTEAGRGSIINMSSALGLVGSPQTFAYVASKFAVNGMTKAAALDLGKAGIRVNSVHPGMIDTPMGKSEDPAALAYVMRKLEELPISRMGQPSEVAAVVAFLASDASSFCTGASFLPDGGWTAI